MSAQFISNDKPEAAAQGNNSNAPGAPVITFPGTNVPQSAQNLTPEQVRSIMVYRAMQSRGGGRGQVRTGVPQFIPFGMPGFFPYPQSMGFAGQQQPQQQQPDAKRASARERRIAARKATEEKKRAAREAAKAKADAKKKDAAK